MNSKFMVVAILLILAPLMAQADAVAELQVKYQKGGAGHFDPKAGEALWNQRQRDAKSGKERSCNTCHTKDLTQKGKHQRTGKIINPMAPSVNPERLTEVRKIKKWLLRNCKWTLGRECSAQEKGDILAYLKGL